MHHVDKQQVFLVKVFYLVYLYDNIEKLEGSFLNSIFCALIYINHKIYIILQNI